MYFLVAIIVMKIATGIVEVYVKTTKDTDLGVISTVNIGRREILIVGRMVQLQSRDFERNENETILVLEVTTGGKKCNSNRFVSNVYV